MISASDVRAYEPLLQQFFFGYQPSQQQLVARKLIPEIDGNDISGQIFKQALGDAYRLWDDSTDNGVAREVSFTMTTQDWTARQKALLFSIFDRDVKAAQTPARPIQFMMSQVLNGLWLNYEQRVATQLNDTGVYANSAATAAFGAAGDDPIGDVTDLIQDVQTASGVFPNTLIMTSDVWRRFANSVDVVERISSTSTGGNARVVTIENITPVLNIGSVPDFRIIVSSAVKNTADKGQTAVMANVWTAARVIAAHFPRTLPQNAPAMPSSEMDAGRVMGQPGAFDGTTTPAVTVFGVTHGQMETWDDNNPKRVSTRVNFDYGITTGVVESLKILTGA